MLNCTCSISLYLLCTVIGLILYFLNRRYTYWARRNVPHVKPVWFKGNLGTVGRTTTIREPLRDVYEKYKGQTPFAGFYFALRGVAVLIDLDLIKNVLIKDFTNFAYRGNYYNEKDDPISAHLFNLDGPKWHDMRKKLTPTFTSLKMNQMLPTVVEIAERFVAVIQKEIVATKITGASETPIEVKALLGRFTTDVIGSCAFGLDCNSLKNPEAEFHIMGRSVFAQRRHGRLVFAFMQSFPNLARKLGIKLARDDVSKFYMRVVKETLEYRDKHNIKRNDFLNLLMELRNDHSTGAGDGVGDGNEVGGLTFEQIAAQSFVFFLAGYETSSSTMGFALYELALHAEIQEKARAEVNEVLKRHNGKFTYEALKQMKYIEQILYETMRMYSIASLLVRQAIHDYVVPGTEHIIEAGTPIIIPVDAIHFDADIYPEPEKFDPERFSPAAVEQRHAMSWLPFGSGPRNCIGSRFGEMQSVVGLAMLLKHFRITPAKETSIPLEIDKNSFVLSTKGGIVLDIQPIVVD